MSRYRDKPFRSRLSAPSREEVAANLEAIARAMKKADKNAEVSYLKQGAATLRAAAKLDEPGRTGPIYWHHYGRQRPLADVFMRR